MRPFDFTSFAPAVCLLVALGAAPQGEPDTKPTPTPGAKKSIAALSAEMQGTWKLEVFETPILEKARRQEAGYLLVAGNFFSFELHVGYVEPNGRGLDGRVFLSGTHRFELDERGRMTATSVIGAVLDQSNTLQFEPPGRARKYDVTCAGTRLVLRRDDGTRYEFERQADSRQQTDIYGRPLKVKEPDKK